MPRARRGLTLIELVIVIVIVAILAAIAIPQFKRTSDHAQSAAMTSDLANLARAQEGYLAEKGSYASDLAQLNVTLSPGVRLVGPITATTSGWSAKVEHPQVTPETCAIFVGAAAPRAPASQEGVAACSR